METEGGHPELAAHRLLTYAGAPPFLHLVDTATGEDAPLPSPTDLARTAPSSFLVRDGFLAYRQSGVGVVTLPATLDGDWVRIAEQPDAIQGRGHAGRGDLAAGRFDACQAVIQMD